MQIIIIPYIYNTISIHYKYTVGAANKTLGYKDQSLIRLKIAWNGPHLAKYIFFKGILLVVDE